MASIIQALFLSDLVILVIPGFALMAITMWAYTQREVVGYMLGWLIGIFLIIVLSSLFPPATTASATVSTGLPLVAVLMATLLGLMLSIVPTLAIFMVPLLRARALALLIAMSLSVVIGGGFFMVMITANMRLAVALFILAYAIGLLTLFMVNRRNETIFADPLAVDPLALDPIVQTVSLAEAQAAGDIPTTAQTTMERFRLARERFQKRSGQGY